jgi:integrase
VVQKFKFSSERIGEAKCAPERQQSIFWDTRTPGLGLRVTAGGARSFIFESRLHGKTLRLTIGDVRTHTIGSAQKEATKYKVQIDQGIDPREVAAEKLATKEANKIQAASAKLRDSVTLQDVWGEYVKERAPRWSSHHVAAHKKAMQAGGADRARSGKKTTAGPLASLAPMRLVDLSTERLELWAKQESATRQSSARLSMRLLKACLNWCSTHREYSAIVTKDVATSSKAREALGKPKVRHDLLQREQLGVWFREVQKIGNPVISAYLQCLLITGARRDELGRLRWADVDFQWQSLKLNDKVEDFRMVPLTPYVSHLLSSLPRRNEWVFSSPTAKSGRLAEPRIAHNQAVKSAGLQHLTLHGLRRSFATLCEWTETPAGIAAQIQGHAPQGVREQNYIRRPLDLLRMWHVKIEAWLLEQAGVAVTL